METAITAEQTEQYLTFHIAGEEYAIAITSVREIIEYGTVTRVPKTPKFIRGVMNLRGAVVPVIDLAVKFDCAESPVMRSTCVVVLEIPAAEEPIIMGLIADSVSQVVELGPSDVEKVPSFGTKVDTEYLSGMAKLGNRFALLLNVGRVLSLDELDLAKQSIADASETQPQSAASEA